jgi:hypothetical protein
MGIELTRATEELNVKLKEVEVQLIASNLGVSVSVPLEGLDVKGSLLVFKKHGVVGNVVWGLYVFNPNAGTTPLLSASRQQRVAAANVLPALIEQLCASVDQNRCDVKQAIIKVDEMIVVLKAAL